MTETEFVIEMERLTSIFGDRNYPRSRVEVMWSEVRMIPADVFRKGIDRFISERRVGDPPVPADFRPVVSRWLEYEHQARKDQGRRDAQEFAMLESEDEQMICDTIKRRLSGQINDEEWAGFMSNVKGMSGK